MRIDEAIKVQPYGVKSILFEAFNRLLSLKSCAKFEHFEVFHEKS